MNDVLVHLLPCGAAAALINRAQERKKLLAYITERKPTVRTNPGWNWNLIGDSLYANALTYIYAALRLDSSLDLISNGQMEGIRPFAAPLACDDLEEKTPEKKSSLHLSVVIYFLLFSTEGKTVKRTEKQNVDDGNQRKDFLDIFLFYFFFLFLCCCCESDESPQPISHANRSLINLTTFPRQLLSLDAIGRTPSASLRLFRPFFLFSFFEGGTISPFSCRFIFSSRSTPSCFPYFDKTALEIVSCGTQLDTAGYCFYRQSSRLVAMLTAEVARASVFCGDPWNEIEKLFAVELPADVLVYFFPPRALALDDGHKRWAISGRLWWRRRVWLCLQCKGMKETEVGLSLSLSVAARWLVER